MEYRRIWQLGGTYFFTVNLFNRKENNLLTREIDLIRNVINDVKRCHPFKIHAWVILPDHMHCVIELPALDSDFSKRWRLIKMDFSKGLPATEPRSTIRLIRGERGIWQRRYWEHVIRDQRDFNAHVDYVHINPLKHGLVNTVKDWPFSTLHKYVADGIYPEDWAGSDNELDYDD